MAQQYNWLQFTHRITIRASAEHIYRAWTTQEGLEKWFLRQAIFQNQEKAVRSPISFMEPGDTYEWYWHGYPDSSFEHHTVLAANGHDYIKFRFSGACIVHVTIKQENEETICELMQDMRPAEESKRQMYFIECSRGWTFYLTNLKSILEGGIDLRNKNEIIQNVINA